jgi:hypothetical protein
MYEIIAVLGNPTGVNNNSIGTGTTLRGRRKAIAF